jgi:hypothetical protein
VLSVRVVDEIANSPPVVVADMQSVTFLLPMGQCLKTESAPLPVAEAAVTGLRISADSVAAANPAARTGFRPLEIRADLDMNDKVSLLS